MEAMDAFIKAGAKTYFDTAYGWAIFPTVAKAGIGIGGAGGVGEVFVRVEGGPPKLVGKANLIQISVGIQFGGQVFSEIIFFEAQKDFENFTGGNFEFGAGASVVALTASVSAEASTVGATASVGGNQGTAKTKMMGYNKGMAIVTIAKGGLMYSATVAGQKFNYKPLGM
eukprot:CAMPEP_0202441812 /NCGR_PEP_ID=MMETSP1360-20130828/1322_1 /ASSEMBLY_ACC=CAM_ASM_000848 /TAXON_ID=515479 /ORGANISM="Licmophora paradoxa, Strain CCMP2313" /LENGTH=169 /DNA_ID=CAMNT_0049056965 /DNA_START=133 /DNA_END=642 /DNA_ORIENTATION=-